MICRVRFDWPAGHTFPKFAAVNDRRVDAGRGEGGTGVHQFGRLELVSAGVAKLTLAFAIRIAPVRFLKSLPFRLGSLCSYCFTKLSTTTLPGTVLTARISLPLRTITRFRCAFGVVMKEPVQSEFTV